MTDWAAVKQDVCRVAREAGIDLVGVADVARFGDVHYRLRPEAHLPGATCVVSLAMRYPRAMYELAGRTDAESTMSLDAYENRHMVEELMVAAMDVTRYLEKVGALAIPMQITHYRVHAYKDIPGDWRRDFDHVVAAAAAGLGEIGLNGVLITPQYGTRQMIISVVTDAPLETDAMYDGPALCDECGRCVETCHMKALDPAERQTVKVGGRSFLVAAKDVWRCMWSKRFMLNAEAGPNLSGMNVTVDPPEGRPITEADVQNAQRIKGEKGGMQTWYMYADRACERNCIPPHLRNEPSLLEQLEGAADA